MKLKFTFKTTTLDIDEEVEYKLDNNQISFDYNNEHYIFDLSKDEIIKDNKESLITIECNKNNIKVYSKEIGGGVEIPVNTIFFDKQENVFEYRYNLIDDEEVNNIIKIEY